MEIKLSFNQPSEIRKWASRAVGQVNRAEPPERLIGSVLWQVLQAGKLNATLLLEEYFEIRKIPVRISDLANAAKGCVEIKQLEELLTRPLRGREEEIGALYTLETRFEPTRAAALNEENFVLELRTAEEPAIIEPAATELEPALM
jgi:hypothetical protein